MGKMTQINIRVSTELDELLRKRAADHPSLSDYLRETLERSVSESLVNERLFDLLSEILSTVSSMGSGKNSKEDNRLNNVSIETLLYLRFMAKPETRSKVSAEMKRLGLKEEILE